MKFRLLMIGKTEEDYIQQGIDVYSKRLKKYAPFEITVIKGLKAGKQTDKSYIIEEEAKLIQKNVTHNELLIVLDENGVEKTSRKFSGFIRNLMLNERKNVVFLIGGAYGLSKEVVMRAHTKLSLSKMTFSHQMVRVIFLEQLYRAFTILKGEPYHHD